MAVPTTAEFLARFPEFLHQDRGVVESCIAEASRSTPDSIWEPRTFDAINYYAAHLLATRTMQIGNQIGSTTGTPTGLGLDSTLYGQGYKTIRDSLGVCAFVV